MSYARSHLELAACLEIVIVGYQGTVVLCADTDSGTSLQRSPSMLPGMDMSWPVLNLSAVN